MAAEVQDTFGQWKKTKNTGHKHCSGQHGGRKRGISILKRRWGRGDQGGSVCVHAQFDAQSGRPTAAQPTVRISKGRHILISLNLYCLLKV